MNTAIALQNNQCVEINLKALRVYGKMLSNKVIIIETLNYSMKILLGLFQAWKG